MKNAKLFEARGHVSVCDEVVDRFPSVSTILPTRAAKSNSRSSKSSLIPFLRIPILHFSLLILTFSMILILPSHVLERNVQPVVLDVPVAALT